MAKTLVVKLAGTVDNDDLRKLGEIRIKIVPVSSLPADQRYTPSDKTQGIILNTNKPIQLKTTGSVHFTDSTLTQDLGTIATTSGTGTKETFYLSDGEGTLRIYDKYAIREIATDATQQHYTWTVDMWDFVGCEAMSIFSVYYVHFTDNSTLEAFSGLTNLTSLVLVTVVEPRVHGNIASLSGLTKLGYLSLWAGNGVYGDISSIARLTGLATFDASGCLGLTGDTSSIAHLHPNNGGKLATFNYRNTKITGSWPPATE